MPKLSTVNLQTPKATTVIKSSRTRVYQGRQGGSFRNFRVKPDGDNVIIEGKLKNFIKLTLKTDKHGLQEFLNAPIRLRGQVFASMLRSASRDKVMVTRPWEN